MMLTRRDALKRCASLVGSLGVAASRRIDAADEHNAAHPALYWHAQGGGRVRCDLCPHACVLAKGQTGICRNRRNAGGLLVALGYGLPCAINVDPIEKKPLYHFLPGSRSYSLAVAGCNLRCKNCQNFSISQVSPLATRAAYRSPQSIVNEAQQSGASSIAFTYSEPIVWFEYMLDIAKLSRKKGLKNVLVSSGYVNPDPFKELCRYLDGAHIDLKSFDDTIYRNLNAGSLSPVLETIVAARTAGVWVEIVNLVVPEWSDDLLMIRKIAAWIRNNVGPDVPLHFSRFFPLYKLAQLYPTPTETLTKARDIAREEQLHYVYIGNVPDLDANTYCRECNALLIERKGYRTTIRGLSGSTCARCKNILPGIWATQ